MAQSQPSACPGAATAAGADWQRKRLNAKGADVRKELGKLIHNIIDATSYVQAEK